MSDLFRKVRNMFTSFKNIFVSSEKPMDAFDKLIGRFKRECPLEIDEVESVKKLCKEISVDDAKDLINARFDTLKEIMMKADIEMRCNSKIIVEDKKLNDSSEYKNFISKEYKRVCTDEDNENKKKRKIKEKEERKKKKYKNEVSWGFLPKEWRLEEKNARADVIKYALTNENEYWGPMIYFGDVPLDEEDTYFDEKYYEKISKKKIKKPKIICKIGGKKTNCRKCLLYEFNQRKYNESMSALRKEIAREKEQNRFVREKWLNGFLYPNKIINNTFCDEDRIWLSYLFYKDFKFSDLNEKEKDLFFKRLKSNTIICMKSLEKGEYNELNEETRKKIEKNELFDVKNKVDNYINSNFFHDDVSKSLEEEENTKRELSTGGVPSKTKDLPIFNLYNDDEDDSIPINLEKLTDRVENEEYEKWKVTAIERQKEIVDSIKNKDLPNSSFKSEDNIKDSVAKVEDSKAEFNNPFSKFLPDQENGGKTGYNDVQDEVGHKHDEKNAFYLTSKEAVFRDSEKEGSYIVSDKQSSNHLEAVKNDDTAIKSDFISNASDKDKQINNPFSAKTFGPSHYIDEKKASDVPLPSLNSNLGKNLDKGNNAVETKQSFMNPFLQRFNDTHESFIENKDAQRTLRDNKFNLGADTQPFKEVKNISSFSFDQISKKKQDDENKLETENSISEKKKDGDKVTFKMPEEFHYYPHYPHNPKKDTSIDPVVKVETHPPIFRRRITRDKEADLLKNNVEEVNFNESTSCMSENPTRIGNGENSYFGNTANAFSSIDQNQPLTSNITSYNPHTFNSSSSFPLNNTDISSVPSSTPLASNPFPTPNFTFQSSNVPAAPSFNTQSSSLNTSYVNFNQDYSSFNPNEVGNNLNVQNNQSVNIPGPFKRKREETVSKYAITDANSIKNPFLPKIDPQSLKPKERKFSDFSMISFSPSNEREFKKIQEIRNNKIEFLGEVPNPFETANPLAHSRDENLRFVDDTFKYSDIFNRDTSNIFLERNTIFNDMIFGKKEDKEDSTHIKYMNKEGENNSDLFGNDSSVTKDPWKK